MLVIYDSIVNLSGDKGPDEVFGLFARHLPFDFAQGRELAERSLVTSF